MKKENKQATFDYIKDSSLLDKTELLHWLVNSIDEDTLAIYKKEKSAPSKREVNKIIEILGYKVQDLKVCGNHLKEYCTPVEWMNTLNY